MNDFDSSKNFTLDPDFLEVSNFTPVRNFGGDYLLGLDGLVQWVSSIRDLRKDMVCLEWESTPITFFYDLDKRTKAKKAILEDAVRASVRAPECTHLDFAFKKPE